MFLFERSRTLTILQKIRKRINQKCHMRQRMMAYAFYYEETGKGRPLILVHEFAGDLRSFEPQLRHFGK
jgi:hypothetical protein